MGGVIATIHVNGIDLFYEVRGAGDAVLLLAGFGCDHTYWEPVVSRLASEYMVICPDNRGCGQTVAPDGACTVERMADDAAALLDHLGVETAHVAGHSLGGEIAQELALRHSARVRSLMLLSTSARASERLRSIIDTAARMPLHAPPEICCRAFLPWLFTEEFFKTPGAVDAALARTLSNPHPPTLEGLAGQSAAIASSTRAGRGIRCPTLVVAGVDDILTPLPWSRDLARRIPGAELAVLDPGAHDLINETPRALCDAMLAFVSRLT
jgi:pimeloyl-ACP methyl ester carboxylesterase